LNALTANWLRLSKEYSVQLSFRQEWNDWRLNFSRLNNGILYNGSWVAFYPKSFISICIIYITNSAYRLIDLFVIVVDLKFIVLTDVNQIWRPDTFFSNEKSSHLHTHMVPNNFVRIYPNGDIMYSARYERLLIWVFYLGKVCWFINIYWCSLSMTLNCTMDLRRYPFDTQTCPMRLANCTLRSNLDFKWLLFWFSSSNTVKCTKLFLWIDGYTTSSVKLEWKDDEPVQVTKYLALPRFKMTDFKTDTCDSSTTTGMEYFTA